MNDIQENKLTLFRTISPVLAKHAAEFANVPALVAARTALDATITLIGDLAPAQQTPTGGIVADKTNSGSVTAAVRVRDAQRLRCLIQRAPHAYSRLT